MAGLKVVMVKEKESNLGITPVYSFSKEERKDSIDLIDWLNTKAIERKDENTCWFKKSRNILTIYERGCNKIPDGSTAIEYVVMIEFLGIVERYKMNVLSLFPMSIREIVRLTALKTGDKNGKGLY